MPLRYKVDIIHELKEKGCVVDVNATTVEEATKEIMTMLKA